MKKITLFFFLPLLLHAMQGNKSQQFFDALDPEKVNHVQALLETDCMHLIDHRYKKGYTPLMMCANLGWCNLLAVLVEFGAKVNARNVNQSTALILAASNGHADCVELLLQAGANPFIKNKDDLTARGWAEKFKHVEVVKVIDDFMQDPKSQLLPLQLRSRNALLQMVQAIIPENQEGYVAPVSQVLREKFCLTRVGKRKRAQKSDEQSIKKRKLSQ